MPRVALALLSASLLALSTSTAASAQRAPAARGQIDTGWQRNGVCYEVFVRSFFDSDGDGIGDFNGLTAKLDHINDGTGNPARSLGAKCIWLMPIAASPSYHGYDVTNYYRINRDYGTTADFRRFMAAAHKRGIKVIVDLVLNHSSSDHPFFKEALRDTASVHRSWYRFSPTNPDIKGPWGQRVWHKSPVRDEYYYGIFTAEMPDLNYENPAVRAEAARIGRFWLTEMGVDGFRLDAVPYLVENGNVLAHTRGTHDVLREFGAMVRRTAPGAYTIGEVTFSNDTLMTYFPDQLDANFSFDASDALIEAVRTGSASKLLAPFLQMQQLLPAPRWSPFQRNHDQTRTMTAIGGDPARARLAASLLLTLPGLPFLYYGEEIGMSGDKPDWRLRTPMHWARGRAAGFTTGNVWEPLQSDSLTANVAAQDGDRSSLLNLYRRLIHLRAANIALAEGKLVPATASANANAAVAYVRFIDARAVLVVANLGATPLAGVKVSVAERTVAPGRYSVRDLLAGTAAATLEIGADGLVREYLPLPTLAPMQTYILELRRIAR